MKSYSYVHWLSLRKRAFEQEAFMKTFYGDDI